MYIEVKLQVEVLHQHGAFLDEATLQDEVLEMITQARPLALETDEASYEVAVWEIDDLGSRA